MLHRLRLAVQHKSFEKIAGHVEIDETFIGGKRATCTADKKRRVAAVCRKSMAARSL